MLMAISFLSFLASVFFVFLANQASGLDLSGGKLLYFQDSTRCSGLHVASRSQSILKTHEKDYKLIISTENWHSDQVLICSPYWFNPGLYSDGSFPGNSYLRDEVDRYFRTLFGINMVEYFNCTYENALKEQKWETIFLANSPTAIVISFDRDYGCKMVFSETKELDFSNYEINGEIFENLCTFVGVNSPSFFGNFKVFNFLPLKGDKHLKRGKVTFHTEGFGIGNETQFIMNFLCNFERFGNWLNLKNCSNQNRTLEDNLFIFTFSPNQGSLFVEDQFKCCETFKLWLPSLFVSMELLFFLFLIEVASLL